jgi:hypothetical protein
MKIIAKPGECEKTYALIKEADNYNGYIVCGHTREAQRIAAQASEMGCKINYPLTYHEVMEGQYSPWDVARLHVDNIEQFMQSYCFNNGVELATVTITMPEMSAGR